MIARFGTAMPGTGLRFDATGRVCPPGHAVTYVAAVASTAVRLIATATAWAGTPYLPRMTKGHDSPAISGPKRPPVPSRVSNNRWGFMETNSVGLVGTLISGGSPPTGGGSPGPVWKNPRFWNEPL